jgi:lipopolysaccharide export system permease protein
VKIVDRHIGLELVWPFLFGVAAFTSIFFAGQNLLKLTSQVLQGMPVMTATMLLALSLPSIIVYTLPMSALLAVLVAFSKLSDDSEVVAMYACGVSLYRAIVPVIWLGTIATGFGFLTSEVIVPNSNRLAKQIQAHALREQISTNKPFVFIDKDTNSTIYVHGGISAKTKTMRDVTITRYNKGEPGVLFQAQKAHWEGVADWSLSDGRMYMLQPGGKNAPESRTTLTFQGLQSKQVRLNKTPTDIAMNLMKPEDMTFAQLRRYVNQLSGSEEHLYEFEVSLYNKLAIPLAALVFALIAAPLAIRPSRTGTSVGIGFSILIIFMYWFVWHFTSALANQGSLPPAIGAFSADVLGLTVGVLLLVRTAK